MDAPKASHPPAETVPPEVKVGDVINLIGDHAKVCSGLYLFRFHREGNDDFFTGTSLTRFTPESVYFEVGGLLGGGTNIKVVGHFFNCSTGAVTTHSFGSFNVSTA